MTADGLNEKPAYFVAEYMPGLRAFNLKKPEVLAAIGASVLERLERAQVMQAVGAC